jgi:GntR family transcriptional regulator, rspAB operon transcriptional repressor
MEARPVQRPNPKLTLEPVRLEGGRGSIAEQVFRTLRFAIITLKLTPATALSEQDIADRLKVSRQPVREAFIKLSEIGLLRVLPQRGTFVEKISSKAVTDARFVREAVECAIARRASEGITKGSIDELRDIIAEQRKAGRAGDEEGFFVLDDAFHRALANAAECAYAWKVVEEAKGQMDRVRFLSIPDAMPTEVPIVQHQAILDAIAAGEVAAADRAMKAHLREILKSLPLLARKFSEMFADEAMAVEVQAAPRPRRKAVR